MQRPPCLDAFLSQSRTLTILYVHPIGAGGISLRPHRKKGCVHVPSCGVGSYQEAAAVSYKMRHQFYKLAGMNRRDFYDFTPQSRPTGDRFVGIKLPCLRH